MIYLQRAFAVLLLPLSLAGCSEYDLAGPANGGDPGTTPTTEELAEVGPALSISPQDYTFLEGCPAAVDVWLTNVGIDPLTIDRLDYAANGDLTLTHDISFPMTLDRGGGAASALGTLTVVSDDPRGNLTAVQGSNVDVQNMVEQFVVEQDPAIDLLFAVDKSGSMSGEMSALSNAVDDFIIEIDQVTSDWKLGVVSHDNGCFNNGVITPTTPSYETVFSDAVGGLQFLGTDLTEALLGLTSVALHQTAPGGCNAGFARADAVMHIIVVSDEPEQSGELWDFWVNEFQNAKADPGLVVISSVVDMNNSCGSGADQYLQASAATGGLVLDVCNSNWGTYAANLGAASVSALRTFYLAAVPDPASIRVYADGVEYTAGWSYDPIRNAVAAGAGLPSGTEVRIEYAAIACDE